MNLRDIVNKEVFAISNCEDEPIHIPGSVQPHGFLLAVDENGNTVFCSGNSASFTGRSPSELLKTHLKDIDQGLHGSFEAAREDGEARHLTLTLDQKPVDVFIAPSEDLWIIELEWPGEASLATEDIFDQTALFVNHIERSKSLRDLCQRIADQTRSITGYDRVMIYRFDKDANGQVFAESKREGLEAFLDLHYPHTDIPVQARELYLRNIMRQVPDVDYSAVPILTEANNSYHGLDLSDAILRSVSPIHIQYLKNMGVAATLTLSIVLEGRLWGLVACHHYTPKFLPYIYRKAALLQTHFLTSQIKVRQAAEEYAVHTVVEAHLQQLLNALSSEGDFQLKFEGFTSLMAVANASGVAILHRGRLYEKGLVPSTERTRALFNWMADHVNGLQFFSSHLSAHYSDGEKISRQAAGVLYHRLGDPKKDAIIWFREEMEKTINWAGDPGEAIKKAVNTLTPRSSFALFKQRLRHQSLEWTTSEVNAASRFASSLQNQFHLEHIRMEEAQQRVLNEKLMKANKELANINWITSHDLKEPLRKILVFASRMMDDKDRELSESVMNSVAKIQSSAMRMNTLVNDIISYTLTDDQRASFVNTDLDELLAEAISTYEDEIRDNGSSIHSEPLPTIPVIPYQIRQLFVNLLGNALKFSKKTEPLRMEISCEKLPAGDSLPLLDQGRFYYRISLKDNGIGFNDDQSKNIFDIFFRLNRREDYAGTGIGLAICKRVCENHDGLITASSQAGVGSVFSIYLPA